MWRRSKMSERAIWSAYKPSGRPEITLTVEPALWNSARDPYTPRTTPPTVVPVMTSYVIISSPIWIRTGLPFGGDFGRGMPSAETRVKLVAVELISVASVAGVVNVVMSSRLTAVGLRLKAPLRLWKGSPTHGAELRRNTAAIGMA